jgi:hypothetical protein
MPTGILNGKAAVAAVAAIALSGGCLTTIASQPIEGEFERTLAVGSDTFNLDVRTGSGRIDVSAGEPGVARVIGRIRGRAGGWSGGSPADVEDRVRALEADPPVSLDGDVLRVGHLDRSRRRRISISYEVVVPPTSTVHARTGSGTVLVEGVAGAVEARTGSGGTRVADVGGDVTARTGSGSIEITAIGGDVNARTGSGSIRIDGIDAALRARTGSGGIRVEGSPGGGWDLDTGSGRIRIDLPDDAAFEIDARTGSGGVRSDHPVTMDGEARRGRLRGTVRGGGPQVTLRTGSGGITID